MKRIASLLTGFILAGGLQAAQPGGWESTPPDATQAPASRPATRPAAESPEALEEARELFRLRRSRTTHATKALRQKLASPHAKVRLVAVVLLAGKAAPGLADELALRLHDLDPRVRAAAVAALARGKDTSHDRKVLRLLDDPSSLVRAAVCRAVLKRNWPNMLSPMRQTLQNDPDPFVRHQAMNVLIKRFGREITPLLIRTLNEDPSAVLRYQSAWLLGAARAGRALPALKTAAMNDPDLDVRARAIRALVLLRPRSMPRTLAGQIVREALDEKPPRDAEKPLPEAHRHHRAVRLLAAMGPEAVPTLIQGLKDSREPVRMMLVRALGQIGEPRARKPLVFVYKNDPSRKVHEAAGKALKQLRK